MKTWSGTVVAIVVLSLIAWSLLSVLAPGSPLEPPEVVVVVGACALVVFAAKSLWAYLRRGRNTDEKES